jgi:hypothetical protein
VRQVAHIIVGLAFWVLTVLLWWLLWREHKATAGALFDTATRVGLCVGIVLGLTIWWINHNVAIYRRKGPRRARADVPANTRSDRLGRRLVWDVAGGAEGARTAGHVVVEVDGDVKTYRAARRAA